MDAKTNSSCMRILVMCESSGTVRNAFRSRGHDAWSCDLLCADDESKFHFQMCCLEAFAEHGPWDMVIAHPPCTYVCVSGIHWNKRFDSDGKLTLGSVERQALTKKAIIFAETIWKLPVAKLAIENPVGVLSTRSCLGKATQYIQPYNFGHDASKKTGLWLRNLPKLQPSDHIPGRSVQHNGKQVLRWANQTDSGQNALPPSKDRWKIRSKTYQRIADAMAEQWGAE